MWVRFLSNHLEIQYQSYSRLKHPKPLNKLVSIDTPISTGKVIDRLKCPRQTTWVFLNHSCHQYIFSVNLTSTKPSLLKWDQRRQEAKQGEADPERPDYEAFKRKGSDVTSTCTKALPKLRQQGTKTTEVIAWGTQNTRDLEPFPLASVPFLLAPGLGPPHLQALVGSSFQDQNRIKMHGGRANAANAISNSVKS
ncbi:hypothetical protein AMTR_s00038p00118510 [Amborella trichopoda]|uniref:Uncharacterized protein n=1 Tax=Amborella trichopoda TaxID=13333 RepID=U5D2K4_AMBTC|nr:hypothetical protein AMTR_s00038p00118510 [Amborella trichopoda]